MKHPVELAADAAVAVAGAGYATSLSFEWLHGVESVVSGALVIVLLCCRIWSNYDDQRRRSLDDRRSKTPPGTVL